MEDISNRHSVVFLGVADLLITTVTLLKWGELCFHIIRSLMGLNNVQFSIYTLVMLLFAFILHPFALYTAYKLLKATRLETELEEAGKRARFWRNLAIIMILFTILGAPTLGFKGYSGGMFAFFILLRLIGIIVVQIFLGEIDENVLPATTESTPLQ